MSDVPQRRLTGADPHHWPSLGDPMRPPADRPGERAFGLTVGGVLLAIAAFSAWRAHLTRAEMLAAVGTILVVTAVARPAWLERPAFCWMRLAGGLGWFNSRVLLTAIFAAVFTPFGIVMRLTGKDPLDRRRRPDSGWSPYPARFQDSKHYERLF